MPLYFNSYEIYLNLVFLRKVCLAKDEDFFYSKNDRNLSYQRHIALVVFLLPVFKLRINYVYVYSLRLVHIV
jgi:hypothetical protein